MKRPGPRGGRRVDGASSTPRARGDAPPRDGRPPHGQSRPRPGPSSSAPRRGGARALDPALSVYGRHAVVDTLQHQRGRAQRLYVLDGGEGLDALVDLARKHGVPVEAHERHALDALVGAGQQHQGAVLACAPFPYLDLEDALARRPTLALVLDGVEDPRNLGASARAAFVLGADVVVVPKDRAASVTASALKASAGALARVPVVQVGNLRRALEQMKGAGMWVVGAEADGDRQPWDVDLAEPTALVVGGEDRGLRRLTRDLCDAVVRIPMAATGTSLNAADAATVLLYEALRQRRGGPAPG